MQRSALIIDDDHHFCALVREAAKAVRVSVIEAGTNEAGWEALSASNDTSPGVSVVFLDLVLLRAPGLDVLAKIRKSDFARDVPVVILTTSSSDADLYASYRFGANAYMVKPQRRDECIAAVQQALQFWCHLNIAPRH